LGGRRTKTAHGHGNCIPTQERKSNTDGKSRRGASDGRTCAHLGVGISIQAGKEGTWEEKEYGLTSRARGQQAVFQVQKRRKKEPKKGARPEAQHPETSSKARAETIPDRKDGEVKGKRKNLSKTKRRYLAFNGKKEGRWRKNKAVSVWSHLIQKKREEQGRGEAMERRRHSEKTRHTHKNEGMARDRREKGPQLKGEGRKHNIKFINPSKEEESRRNWWAPV